jgi:hypothetical protein
LIAGRTAAEFIADFKFLGFFGSIAMPKRVLINEIESGRVF